MASPADDMEPVRKRQRKAKSCEQCRTRKVRCDMTSPCGPCQRSRHHLSCTYRDITHPPPSGPPPIPPPPPGPQVAPKPHQEGPPRFLPPPPDPKVQQLEHRVRRLEDQAAAATHVIGVQQNTTPVASRLRITPDKVKWFGPSHWVHTAEKVTNLLDFVILFKFCS